MSHDFFYFSVQGLCIYFTFILKKDPRKSSACILSHSLLSDSLWLHGLYSAWLLHPWNFLGKNARVGCHFLLQGIFLTQELNPCLLWLVHWQAASILLSHLGSPILWSVRCEIALCLKCNVHSLIQTINALLLNSANHLLKLQWVIIFLLVESLASVLLVADWSGWW